MMHVLATIICVLYFVYRYLNYNYDYWKKRNVPFHPPVTFFGNVWDTVIIKRSLAQIYADIYKYYKDVPYVGIFKIRQPVLLVKDPDIIKNILVKDFHSFEKNGFVLDEKVEPLAGKNPFFQSGQRWKTTRSQLTPCFSSAKIKLMFPLMLDVSKNMTKYLEKESGIGSEPLEAKELSAKFTTDNVASCAFGLEGKSFEDPNAEFRKAGKELFNTSFSFAMKSLVILLFPSMNNILKLSFVSKRVGDYFRNIITNTMKYREENKIERNDFLDLVNKLKFKSWDKPYTDEDVTSHALSFFIDGFETSSGALSFTLHEIAANPDVQKKLRKELEETLKKNGGVLTYEAVQEMNYLDCVLSESLRRYPPATFLSKVATLDYDLPPCKKTGKTLTIEKGTEVVISVDGLHNDPKYFPNPEKFDPDRFSELNKSNIVKGAYLPFGDGPRQCLGMKFAVLQIKIAILTMVRDFNIVVNKRTKEPLEIDAASFLPVAKGGIWLDFSKLRSEST